LTFNLFYAIIVSDMERVWSTTRRGFSARSILTFVLTVFLTALLWVTFGNHTDTHADSPVASWNGSSILYNGNQYFSAGTAQLGDSINLPVGTNYYVYTPDSTDGAPTTTVKAMVIYFSSGVDPPTAKTATYATYDYSPSKVYSNPSASQAITITPSGDQSSYSSCTIQGIGWIICPITTFLADGMDNIFNIVKGFLVVQPANTTNTNNDLYIAWSVMRSIANVAFVIVFLIIIYSQLTNAGISNYGLKKLLPRLIIAAVLVNLSYFICAIAVDLSNILGYSLQDIFVQIRQNTFNISNNTWSNSTGMGWSAIAAFVLSGGAATVGIIAATGGTVAGAIYLLIPLLIGLVLTVLFVLLILAARQAIIILLIVVAPLAFVAYLLPNTEQWFKKWRELFMTMLVFFPAFSLVFGGAQLAGGLIIQNATSIIGVIFGMAVQVAPLVITPLLLKLSGGLLGQIAGIVNNPKKGLLDRTKNWSNARAEMHKQRGIGEDLKRRQVLRRAARNMALSDNRVERATNRYKAGFEAEATRRAMTSKAGQKIEVEQALAKARTEEFNESFGKAMSELKAGDETGLAQLRMAEGTRFMESVQSRLSGDSVEEIRTRRYQTRDAEGNLLAEQTTRFGKLAVTYSQRARELDELSRAIKTATAVAENIQVTNYSKSIEDNVILKGQAKGLKEIAGGIAGERGQAGALAAAFKAQSEAHGTAVANANSIMSHYNYGDDDIVELAQGKLSANTRKNFTNVSAALKEAAITKIAGGANAGAILNLMKNIQIDTTDENIDFRQAFADTLLTNSAKPKFAAASVIADIKQGKIPTDAKGNVLSGQARIDQYIIAAAKANKFGSAETLVTQDRDYLEAVQASFENRDNLVAIDATQKATILKSIKTIRKNPLYSGKVGERKDSIDAIERLLKEDPEYNAELYDKLAEGDDAAPANDE
jgi:hypothetical protein